MRDAAPIALVVGVAAVLIVRAIVGHKVRRRRKFSLTIEWDDGGHPDKEVADDPGNDL